MIAINFFWAVAVFFVALVALPLFVWALVDITRSAQRTYLKDVVLSRCGVCFHMYLKNKDANFSVCPRCKSYNK